MLCNCLSWKHKVQLSETEVNKHTFAIRLSRVLSPQNHSPLWSPLHTWFTVPSPFSAWQELPDVPSLCGRSPQLHSMCAGEQWQGWLGGRMTRYWVLGTVSSGGGKPCLRTMSLLPSMHWRKNCVVWVCVPACCCCYSMATDSNCINGISHSREVIKDSVTRHRLLLAW